jgi:hypothetical protein
MFVDVSCDTTNPNNPFPIYKEVCRGRARRTRLLRVLTTRPPAAQTTTLFNPVLSVVQDPPLVRDAPATVARPAPPTPTN